MNFPTHSRIAVALTALVAVASLVTVTPAQEDRWAEAMAAFADADRTSPPPQHGVVFVGSSSIRFWDLEKSFPGRGYLNRGFGGSEISDSIKHIELLVLKHRPQTVVMYAGDNDIARGKSAQEVVGDFKSFAAKVHAELPGTRIAFIAIKPSTLRWEMVDEMRKANVMIREFVDGDDRQEMFVDTMERELSCVGAAMEMPIDSIFVGGGTPTLLAPALLARQARSEPTAGSRSRARRSCSPRTGPMGRRCGRCTTPTTAASGSATTAGPAGAWGRSCRAWTRRSSRSLGPTARSR